MRRFLVIDSDGPRVEHEGYRGVARDPYPNELLWRYFKHYGRIEMSLRYIDPEAK